MEDSKFFSDLEDNFSFVMPLVETLDFLFLFGYSFIHKIIQIKEYSLAEKYCKIFENNKMKNNFEKFKQNIILFFQELIEDFIKNFKNNKEIKETLEFFINYLSRKTHTNQNNDDPENIFFLCSETFSCNINIFYTKDKNLCLSKYGDPESYFELNFFMDIHKKYYILIKKIKNDDCAYSGSLNSEKSECFNQDLFKKVSKVCSLDHLEFKNTDSNEDFKSEDVLINLFEINKNSKKTIFYNPILTVVLS